ncbi:hypothetical protein LguiB_002008 [Lonicera macranthoides]
MWSVGVCVVVGLATIFIGYWVEKWRNPKCNGILPPGSMGFPLLGETLSLLIPGRSLDLHPFVKKRLQRYGPIFKTSLGGLPVVVSTDAEVNHNIFLQEGRSVELWYMSSFAKLFNQDGDSRTNALGAVHRYVRGIVLNHFGAESLKQNLLAQIEVAVDKSLQSWSTQESVDVKHAVSSMAFEFTAKRMFSYDPSKSSEKIDNEQLANLLKGLMSFPVDVPGTEFHKCMKVQKAVTTIVREKIKEKRNTLPENRPGDLLDQAVKDMETEKFVTDDFLVPFIFAILFASFESISSALTLTFKLLSEHPAVVEELIAEHDRILKNRGESTESPLTWEEYKSMTFTHHVVSETLRLSNVAPGFLRRALKDVEDLDSRVVSKNFIPFGGGMRQCAGAEFSKAFMGAFLHVLVTKYRYFKNSMLSAGVCVVVGLVTILIGYYWVKKWRNPKSNGILPPGFMGFPLIGETLQLLIPGHSLDLHPFLKKRFQRYGQIFKTSLGGLSVVVSADPEFNHNILIQEGRSVELWYMSSFSKLFNHEGESRTNKLGAVHRYGRSIVLSHFGAEPLKESLLAEIEVVVDKSLHTWSTQESVDVKHAVSTMVFDFTGKCVFSYDPKKLSEKIDSKQLANLLQGLMSFPVDIPGTKFHKCMKVQKMVTNIIRNKIKEKRSTLPEKHEGDLLDQAMKDMETEKFVTNDFLVSLIFAILFASFESISSTLTLAFKLLSEHPVVVEELIAEHNQILKNRGENLKSFPISWEEYKSMTFTHHVVSEILRLSNVAPGFLRRALKDVEIYGKER